MKCSARKVQLKDQGSHLIIESGKKAIISWDEFSLGKVESIHFAQASEKSSVLNRIRGSKPSEIFGEISSNGSVYLLNPKGIIFGKDCRINVASLVASTLDVLNEDFLRGEDLPFIGDSRARILNLGKMDLGEGEIFLLAREIDQRGELKAEYVGLGSSRDILLRAKGEQRIFVKPDIGGNISCEGDIRAAVTEIRSGSPYAKAIRLRGRIEGVVSKEENGRIYLVAEEGRTIVEGRIMAPKGEVHLLGDEVVLTDSANVDVSSSSGGGTILVGGDTQGANPNIFTSTYTMASNEAKLRADAWKDGDGGRIIFWANKSAQIYGDISVRGGEEGGDGGFVEVSGREHFAYHGTSDRSAPKGKAGKLLLGSEEVCRP